MFSISKALALIAILAAVWFGFKLIGRLDEARKRKLAQTRREETRRDETRRDAAARDDSRAADGKGGVLDLVRDKSGAYVAKEKRDDHV